ncbi:hypothetical protein [Treponema endosymbiont of Eucomonympha sp.]|nr:hypothetical protein [Treponema endosymbiont of Eucomonympha sp.]
MRGVREGIGKTLADAAVGELAGDIRMIDSTYIKAHAAAVRTLVAQKGG